MDEELVASIVQAVLQPEWNPTLRLAPEHPERLKRPEADSLRGVAARQVFESGKNLFKYNSFADADAKGKDAAENAHVAVGESPSSPSRITKPHSCPIFAKKLS